MLINYACRPSFCCKIYSFVLFINDIVGMQVVLQGFKIEMESMAETVDFHEPILNMAVGKLTLLEKTLEDLGDKVKLNCSLSYANYQFYEEKKQYLIEIGQLCDTNDEEGRKEKKSILKKLVQIIEDMEVVRWEADMRHEPPHAPSPHEPSQKRCRRENVNACDIASFRQATGLDVKVED